MQCVLLTVTSSFVRLWLVLTWSGTDQSYRDASHMHMLWIALIFHLCHLIVIVMYLLGLKLLYEKVAPYWLTFFCGRALFMSACANQNTNERVILRGGRLYLCTCKITPHALSCFCKWWRCDDMSCCSIQFCMHVIILHKDWWSQAEFPWKCSSYYQCWLIKKYVV